MCVTLCDFNFFRQSCDQLHAARFQSWAQISLGRGPSFPVVDGLLHRAKALLLLPVIICGCFVPRLYTRLDKGCNQRIVTLAPCHMQWAVFPTPFGITAMSRRCPAFLAQIIGKHIGIRPTMRTHFRPRIKIARMPAHVDHAINTG